MTTIKYQIIHDPQVIIDNLVKNIVLETFKENTYAKE